MSDIWLSNFFMIWLSKVCSTVFCTLGNDKSLLFILAAIIYKICNSCKLKKVLTIKPDWCYTWFFLSLGT